MPDALLRAAVAVAATAASLVGAVPAHAAATGSTEGPQATVEDTAFSPNGDGILDRAQIRFTLPTAGPVSITVQTFSGERHRHVRFGHLAAGTHVWTWDGRADGRVLPADYYEVRVRTDAGVASGYVHLDLRFDAQVWLANSYGRPPSQAPAVYPRTRVVRDSIGLLGVGEDGGERRGVLVIRNSDGSTVARRNLIARPTGHLQGGSWKHDPMMWAARDQRGRPLPPGRYFATVRGTDQVGNRGVSKPLRIWVSADRLEWVDETRHVEPQDVAHGSTCGVWSSGNGCGDFDPCGPVVPSALFPGGLSHQGAESCPAWSGVPGAASDSWIEVPEAVRGIPRARVSFSGAPTHAGEPDTGTLRMYSFATDSEVKVTSGRGGTTGWVEDPWGGSGSAGDPDRGEPRVLPSVLWSFSTSSTDSFDVASYTVDMRYLAVAD